MNKMFEKKGQISSIAPGKLITIILMTVAFIAIFALLILIYTDKVPNIFSGAINWLK
tara:strand:- start:2454 stop:2624 length:171 start_codon:yes stop_codon:yes gene_type:complete